MWVELKMLPKKQSISLSHAITGKTLEKEEPYFTLGWGREIVCVCVDRQKGICNGPNWLKYAK